MTDKNIENWINRISESKNGCFLLNKQIDLSKNLSDQAKILSENLNVDYLEKELNLVIRFLSENDSANIIKLSKKGIEVADNGGWIKYKHKEIHRKNIDSLKINVTYWFGIIIPLISLLVAVWAIKKDNLGIESQVLIKLKQPMKEILKKEIDSNIEMLTRKMDSVLLKNLTIDVEKN